MNMHTIKTAHPLVIAAAVSMAVFSLVGTAAILGWIPVSKSTPASGTVSQAVDAHKLAAGTAVDTPRAEAKAEPRAEAGPAPARHASAQRAKPRAQTVTQPAAPAVVAHSEPTSAKAEPATRAAQAEPAAEPVRKQCYECGTIESVRETEKQGETNGVGIGAGAVAGGVLGHQMGAGRGNDLMTILGAIGGAVAGHQIEKKMKKTMEYQVPVRFEDGTTQHIVMTTPPAWHAGDKVKVVNGTLMSNS